MILAVCEIVPPLGLRSQIELGSRFSLDRFCNAEQVDEPTAFQFQFKLLDRDRAVSGNDVAAVDGKSQVV
jgi:hypothetical protein